MKKIFVDVRTGKQVSLGQPYDIQFTGPQGSMRLAGDQMNKSVLNLLIACGAVIEAEVSEEEKERSIYGNLGGVPDNAGFYISQAGKKLGIDPLSACKLLEMVAIMNPTAFFSILLREVAVELDKKYPDHIENSKEIYYINVFNGTITKAADLMMESGAKSVRACASHCVMSGPASDRVQESALEEIVFTDSIPYTQRCAKVKQISVAEMFAETIRRVIANESISDQYIV